jgi:hypothetical protein
VHSRQFLSPFSINRENKKINFDSDTALSSSDYVNLTGISKENFDELHTYIKEHIRNTPARSTKTYLGIFLFKMKAGISNKVISTIFNISRSSLTRAISSVRQALMQTFACTRIKNSVFYPTLIGLYVCLYLVLSLCGYLFIYTVQFFSHAAYKNYFSFYVPG